ncbi:MAG: WbuC family cupin fold metalloprotein [Candidatus Limimorpha sp.]
MIIDEKFLDSLSEQARRNPRLRQSFDLRTTPGDGSQRMLNALEPGTVMPIHRHRNSSETMVLLRGSLRELFYDDDGNLTEDVMMWHGGENRVLQVEKGRWHSLECLEAGTVIFESKDGRYEPLTEMDILDKV